MLKQLFLSLLVGILTGGIFAILKLPIPAPTAFEGVLGILGIFVGYLLIKNF
ncbi:MAG: XapX domain-containing protein [Candidatus Pacebacteria bacterium]|jgi:XapX domain-containing protein|nr:XapX domain-containing protein [Candidatus Paceibacterota bacterium]